MVKQPADPIQHMLDCLKKGYPTGPLKVVVSSPPGLGRESCARKLAEHFDLVYISAGELLREAEVDTSKLSYADDEEVTKLVMELIGQAEKQMRGFVLDGFPRTIRQTTFLKERSVVPTHVLKLKATGEFLLQRQKQIADGSLQGSFVAADVFEQKLRLHACHNPCALHTYADRTTVIDVEAESEAEVFSKMEKFVRTRPRSKGPSLPPRIVIMGPRGSGACEYAQSLAARLDAVFVNGQALQEPGKSEEASFALLPGLDRLAQQDALGTVGARLKQTDCVRQGWVIANFPLKREDAEILAKDPALMPLRVVTLQASAEACLQRLRQTLADPEEYQPEAVQAAHKEYQSMIGGAIESLSSISGKGRFLELPAEGSPEEVFAQIVEFVERPLPKPPRAG